VPKFEQVGYTRTTFEQSYLQTIDATHVMLGYLLNVMLGYLLKTPPALARPIVAPAKLVTPAPARPTVAPAKLVVPKRGGTPPHAFSPVSMLDF
jgi:hypothetical protein